VLKEMKTIEKLGISYVRILDDTFNADKTWASEICKLMTKENLHLQWGALSRVDTLDEDLLQKMRRAGCRRLYIGIESGSQRVLDYYKKGYVASEISSRVRRVRSAGIEAVGFFLLGAPIERWADVRKSIELAKQCDLDFVIVSKLVVYPGTALEGELGNLAHVDPWAAEHRFVDEYREREILDWERRFYRSFYSSYSGIRTGARTLLKDPKRAVRSAYGLLRYSLTPTSPKKHPDYL